MWWTIGLVQTLLPAGWTPKRRQPAYVVKAICRAIFSLERQDWGWSLVRARTLRVQEQRWLLEDTSQELMLAADWLPPSRGLRCSVVGHHNLVGFSCAVGSHPAQQKEDTLLELTKEKAAFRGRI
jgi:hypothetical protein